MFNKILIYMDITNCSTNLWNVLLFEESSAFGRFKTQFNCDDSSRNEIKKFIKGVFYISLLYTTSAFGKAIIAKKNVLQETRQKVFFSK